MATLYYKTPDMKSGKDSGMSFSSSSEVQSFLECAPGNMPENTLFYYSLGPGRGEAWILREGKIIQIWSPRVQRRLKIGLYEMITAAPALSTEELKGNY